MAGLKDRGYFTRTGPTVQMHVWYLQGRRRAVTGLGPFWDRAGPEEPEERKGRGPGWAAGCLPPATPHLSTPHLSEEGASWARAGRGGTLSVTPPHAPLTHPSSPACALGRILKVLCWGDLKALYRHWSDGSLPAPGEGKEATGSGQVTSPRAETRPKSLRTAPPQPLVALAPPPPFAILEWGRGETAESGRGWG